MNLLCILLSKMDFNLCQAGSMCFEWTCGARRQEARSSNISNLNTIFWSDVRLALNIDSERRNAINLLAINLLAIKLYLF